jgi:hypothetical protein
LQLQSHHLALAFVEQTLGWQWVGRIRNRGFIAAQPEHGFSATSLYPRATTRDRFWLARCGVCVNTRYSLFSYWYAVPEKAEEK